MKSPKKHNIAQHGVVEDRVAESMAQAVAWSGLKKPQLQWAKAEGCGAFRGARVYLGEFLPWWEQNKHRLKDDPKLPSKEILDRRLKAQRLEREALRIERAKREDDEKRGKLIQLSEVRAAIREIAQHQHQVFRSKREHELPTRLKGLDEIAIRELLQESVDEVCEIFTKGTERWVGPEQPDRAEPEFSI